MKSFYKIALAATSIAAMALPAHAATFVGTFAVKASEGVRNGAGFDVANGSPFSGTNTAQASFTYTGALDFSNTAAQNTTPPGPLGDLNSSFGFSNANVSGYTGSGTVNYMGTRVADFRTLSSFLASSGSSSDLKYGSYYEFSLGQLVAGTVLTITHDDGAAIYQGSTRVGSTEGGPTGVRTSVVTIGTTGDTVLRYGRQNGTPSVLKLDAVAPVPEPGTWMTMILGFGVVGASMRRRKAATPQLV
jgi:hypothetical protein